MPAQLNNVIVLLSIPADFSHKDKLKNISKIVNLEENPKINFERLLREGDALTKAEREKKE